MRKVFNFRGEKIKLFALIAIMLLLTGCGEETLEDSANNDSGFRHNTKLVNNEIVPKSLNMNLNVDGMQDVTMFFSQEMLEKNDRTLTVPVAVSGSRILDKYNVSRSPNFDNYVFNCTSLTEGFETTNGTLIVNISMPKPSGLVSGVSEEGFLEGYKPTYGVEGAESYFFDDNFSGLKNDVCRYNFDQGGLYNSDKKESIKIISALEKKTSTYAGVFLSYYYGSDFNTYTGTNYQGYYQTLNIQQQLTHELIINIDISWHANDEVRNADEIGRFPSDEQINIWKNEADETMMDIFKIYGIYDQSIDIINNGSNIRSEMSTCL